MYFDSVYFFAGEKKSKFNVKFDDRSVCKSFLLGCCPHEILSATVSVYVDYNHAKTLSLNEIVINGDCNALFIIVHCDQLLCLLK